MDGAARDVHLGSQDQRQRGGTVALHPGRGGQFHVEPGCQISADPRCGGRMCREPLRDPERGVRTAARLVLGPRRLITAPTVSATTRRPRCSANCRNQSRSSKAGGRLGVEWSAAFERVPRDDHRRAGTEPAATGKVDRIGGGGRDPCRRDASVEVNLLPARGHGDHGITLAEVGKLRRELARQPDVVGIEESDQIALRVVDRCLASRRAARNSRGGGSTVCGRRARWAVRW